MNVLASLVDRPADPESPTPLYYVRPTGAALARHGLPTGIQRTPTGAYRAVIRRRHVRTFPTVAEALAWRELAVRVLAVPLHVPSDDPTTEAVRLAMLRGGLSAVGL